MTQIVWPQCGWRAGLNTSILSVLVMTLVAACSPSPPTTPYDDAYWAAHSSERDAAYAALKLEQSEESLDAATAKLPEVSLDAPPKIGEDYNPSFPAELPFEASRWLTTVPSPSVADPRATRGGQLKVAIQSFPPTIRSEGPNSRLSTLSTIHGLIYETLLDYDFTLGDFVPALATHWQIGDDKKTFRFRLNPKARWADGRPVTADDVVATFEHLKNPDRKDPSTARYYSELIKEAKALDRLTVEVKAAEARWRSMISIGLSTVYPAAYMRMDGETYIQEWNWKLPPGTGPYTLSPADIKKGRSITLRRRNNYWDEGNPHKRGTYNFGEVRFEVVRDRELMYQKLLAGELDMYFVSTAQRWVDEIDKETAVNHGWIQKRRIWNRAPNGLGGYCFNMRVAPFDSRNVRLAFAHLFNREKLFAKYFFYQYEYMDSYYPGQVYARPDAKPVRFDADRARALLATDGWSVRNDAGQLTKEDGTLFPLLTLEIANAGPASMRIHNLVKDELWREAGIRMELKEVDGSSLLKRVWDQKFQVVYWFWSAGMFPSPEFQYHSKFADQKQSNNLNGLNIPEVDKLIDAYKYEFDGRKRQAILQQMDKHVFEAHPYALSWYAPYFRVLYWNKFGHPREYASRFGSDLNNILFLWWHDKEREKTMLSDRAAGRATYPDKPVNQYDTVEQDYWMHNDVPMEKRR